MKIIKIIGFASATIVFGIILCGISLFSAVATVDIFGLSRDMTSIIYFLYLAASLCGTVGVFICLDRSEHEN